MDAMTDFFNSLARNVALLLVAMPLIGAALVRLMSRSGREPVYFTALTNVWLCCGLIVVAVQQFETGSDFESLFRPQMLTSLDWPGLPDSAPAKADRSGSAKAARQQRGDASEGDAGPSGSDASRRVRFPCPRLSVAMNGLNLWLVALTVAATTAAVRSIDLERDFLAARLSWLLLTEAALVGTLVAQDVILLSGFNLLSVLGLFFLIGHSSSNGRRIVARQFFRVQSGGALLLSIGLIGAAVSHWWMTLAAEVASPISFSLNQIIAQVPDLAMTTESGRVFWNDASPWLFVLLCGAFVLRVPIPPLHHWWLHAVEQSDRCTSALMACGFLPAGLYGVARIIGPLFPEQSVRLAPRLMTWALVAAALLALSGLKLAADRPDTMSSSGRSGRASVGDRLSRLIGIALIVCLTLAFGALITGESLAIRGGLLMAVSASASAGLAFWLLPPATERNVADNRTARATRCLMWLAVCGLVAAPLSGTFWGLLIVAHGYLRHSAMLTLLVLTVVVLLAGTVLRVVGAQSPDRGLAPSGNSLELNGRGPTIIGLLPLSAVILLTLICPSRVMGPPLASGVDSSVTSSSGSADNLPPRRAARSASATTSN